MGLLAKLFGAFLVADGILSIATHPEENALYQAGRVARTGIGLALLLKKDTKKVKE